MTELKKAWLGTSGYVQPVGSGGLSRLKEKNHKFWFVIEDSNLLYYDQQAGQTPPVNKKAKGEIDLMSSSLDIHVTITCTNGKEFLLSPPRDVALMDWITQLKTKASTGENPLPSNFERAKGTTLMSKTKASTGENPLPSNFERSGGTTLISKTKASIGENPLPSNFERSGGTTLMSKTKASTGENPLPSNFEKSGGTTLISKVRNSLRRRRKSASPRLSLLRTNSGEEPKTRSPGSSTSPTVQGTQTIPVKEVVTTGGPHLKDRPRSWTLPSEMPLDVSPRGFTDNVYPLQSSLPKGAKSFEDRACDTTTDMSSLLLLEYPDEDCGDLGTRAVSRDVQTDEGLNGRELLTPQQQKMTRGLEMEICKLTCEVISLIQGTIKVPLKDDDLADWHFVEDVRYKERVYGLLREARYYNAKLPCIDSSVFSNFKDSYGFVHGSRESESEFFHYVCRELTQHYSKFFENKTGHVQLWKDYVDASESRTEKIMFKKRELHCLVRDGIPRDLRADVWKSVISEKVAHIKHEKGADYYNILSEQVDKRKNVPGDQLSETERQIKIDLLRTMPTNERFKHLESEGIFKLSTILQAFCLHRPDIGYLQGMNFIVAMCLLSLDEEDAFWSLVAVTEIYLKNYFDDLLSGAQADLLVLNELVGEMLPALHAHFKYYTVDVSTVTFNWFITVFVDAVPFETVLRIWDCFLFEGREALFRIALGMLKLQQRSLLQLSGALAIMQYMKRCARVTYDADRLLKASFDEWPESFPNNDALDEKQKKYLADIKAKQAWRITVKSDKMRSRVSSFSVDIQSVGRPDQHQLVECALATSQDLSTPVCLFCGSRDTTQLYLLDIKKKEMTTIDIHITSRVLCAELVGESLVLVGTVDWYIHAFPVDLGEEVWCIQLSDSVIDLCHQQNGKVYAAMADGSIAVLQNATEEEPPSSGSHTRIGRAPVTCVTMVNETVWCGCGNNVVILNESSLEELDSLVVSSSPRHQVAKLLHGEHGVWCTIRGSSFVILLDDKTFDVLLKVDVTNLQSSYFPGEPTCSSTPVSKTPGCDNSNFVSHFQESRVTTVMPLGQELWVGLANGQVLIFDVLPSNHDDEEAPDEQSGEVEKSSRAEQDRSDQKLELEKEEMFLKEGNATQADFGRSEGLLEGAIDPERVLAMEESGKLKGPCKKEKRRSELNSEESREDATAPVTPTTTLTGKTSGKERRRKRVGTRDAQKLAEAHSKRRLDRIISIDPHQDYKFSLKIRVLYRISEEAIRCLLLLREQVPMVLSCAGTLSGEGALSLWRRQVEPMTTRTENVKTSVNTNNSLPAWDYSHPDDHIQLMHTDEWLPRPIKHRRTEKLSVPENR